MKYSIISTCPPSFICLLVSILLLAAACSKRSPEHLPEIYQQSGAFIKTLPYFNPDSCVLLVRREVPAQWQGAAYENLILDGPENSPLELGFQHLDVYEKNFPADSARAFAQLWRGRFLSYLDQLDSAKTCIQESLDISRRIKNPFRECDAQAELATLFYQKGNTAEALQAYLTVYDALKNLGASHTERKVVAMANLSNVYQQSGNNRAALVWAQRYLPLVADESQEALRSFKVDALRQIGSTYTVLNLPDSAILTLQAGIRLCKKYKTINSEPQLLSHLGAAYLAKNDCMEAHRCLLEAQHEYIGQNPILPSSFAINLAKTYLCLGRLDSAEMLFKIGLQSPSTFFRTHIYSNLGKLYARRGDFRAASQAFETSLELQQTYASYEKVQEMGAAQVQLELKNAQLELQQLAQKHQTEQQQKLIVSLFLALGLFFLLALFFRQRGRNRILEQDKMLLAQEKDLAEARELLRTQELERSKTALKKSKHSLKTTQEELETAKRLLNLKNQIFEDLQLRLEHPENTLDNATIKAASAQMLHRMKILTDSDWHHFRAAFEGTFPGFQLRLKSAFPTMTAAETRLFLLHKLNFNTNEISEALGISSGSVYRSRYRLAKKLGAADASSLDEIVRQFE